MAEIMNDWAALIAKPESNKKNYESEGPDAWYQKRENCFYYLNSSDSGSKYDVAIVPDRDGVPFVMTEIATIKRFRFTSPKTGIHYFENMKIPVESKTLFNMDLVQKGLSGGELTEEEKEELLLIKRHGELIQRYKEVVFNKDFNFKWAQKKTFWTSRIKKVSLTAFLGVWTNWEGTANKEKDYSLKLFTSTHNDFQTKFRGLIESLAATHSELQPTWFKDFFSVEKEVKGLIDMNIGSMKVGGAGATIKLVKVGKDPIDDAAAGYTSVIKKKDIKNAYEGEENEASIMHWYLGMKSDGRLYQAALFDRFEEAITQLEDKLSEVRLANLKEEGETPKTTKTTKTAKSEVMKEDDLPF